MSEAIDMSPAGMDAALAAPRTTKPWRPYGIGSSELGKLYMALGKLGAPASWTDRKARSAWAREIGARVYMVDEVRPLGPWNEPQYLLEKAGILERPLPSPEALAGTKREAELFRKWRDEVRSGRFHPPAAAFERSLDPASIGYATTLPREWPPLIEVRDAPRLNFRPDAWARTRVLGTLVNVQLKCTRWPGPWQKDPPWWDHERACWYYELQQQSEMSIGGADDSLLVVGIGWARDPLAPDQRGVKDGPIKVFHLARDRGVIREIRDAVAAGWDRVLEIRSKHVPREAA